MKDYNIAKKTVQDEILEKIEYIQASQSDNKALHPIQLDHSIPNGTNKYTLLDISGSGELCKSIFKCQLSGTNDYYIFTVTVDGEEYFRVKLTNTKTGPINSCAYLATNDFTMRKAGGTNNQDYDYLMFKSGCNTLRAGWITTTGNYGKLVGAGSHEYSDNKDNYFICPLASTIKFNTSLKIEVEITNCASSNQTGWTDILYGLD